MQEFDDQLDDDLGPSKSQRKRDMRQVQQLCADLADINMDSWLVLELPDPLRDSIALAARLKSSNARNRQLRHAAKILAADADLCARVDAFFTARQDQARHAQQAHKLIEQWRDRLLDADTDALSDFFNAYPQTDRQELGTLVRNARREKQANKTPAQQRKLFKYLRDYVF